MERLTPTEIQRFRQHRHTDRPDSEQHEAQVSDVTFTDWARHQMTLDYDIIQCSHSPFKGAPPGRPEPREPPPLRNTTVSGHPKGVSRYIMPHDTSADEVTKGIESSTCCSYKVSSRGFESSACRSDEVSPSTVMERTPSLELLCPTSHMATSSSRMPEDTPSSTAHRRMSPWASDEGLGVAGNFVHNEKITMPSRMCVS